jgi:hypothetical protein
MELFIPVTYYNVKIVPHYIIQLANKHIRRLQNYVIHSLISNYKYLIVVNDSILASYRKDTYCFCFQSSLNITMPNRCKSFIYRQEQNTTYI